MQVNEIIAEAVAWKRQGNKVTRKYRCTTGPRKGQVRASPAACNAPINVKARHTLNRTKTRTSAHGRFRQQRTKRRDPISRRLTTLNKPRARKVR
jgi:hypothetical protein